MHFWQRKSFKDLQKVWYQKVANSGFNDIECVVGDEQELIQSSTYPFRYNPSMVERQNKQLYFEELSSHVQEETFKNEVDEIILTKRAEGMKIKEILEELQRLGHKRARETVRFTIRKYENSWGIRSWQPNQMTCNRKKEQPDDNTT